MSVVLVSSGSSSGMHGAPERTALNTGSSNNHAARVEADSQCQGENRRPRNERYLGVVEYERS